MCGKIENYAHSLMRWKGHFGGWVAMTAPIRDNKRKNGGKITWLVLLV